jgi:hypothetical protein
MWWQALEGMVLIVALGAYFRRNTAIGLTPM